MGSKLGKFMKGILGTRDSQSAPDLDPKNAVEYKGCKIHPASRPREGQWLTAGVITKELEDRTGEHRFIRADIYVTKEDADACAVLKGKRLIDERGDRLFAEETNVPKEGDAS